MHASDKHYPIPLLPRRLYWPHTLYPWGVFCQQDGLPSAWTVQGPAGHHPSCHTLTHNPRADGPVSAIHDGGCGHHVAPGDVVSVEEEKEVRVREREEAKVWEGEEGRVQEGERGGVWEGMRQGERQKEEASCGRALSELHIAVWVMKIKSYFVPYLTPTLSPTPLFIQVCWVQDGGRWRGISPQVSPSSGHQHHTSPQTAVQEKSLQLQSSSLESRSL